MKDLIIEKMNLKDYEQIKENLQKDFDDFWNANILESELKNLQTEERELSSEIVKLKDPEYIAKYARENYLYSMEGEYVIKIEDKKEEVKESDNTNDKIYYIMGITISILIVLLIAVIIKIVKNKKSK